MQELKILWCEDNFSDFDKIIPILEEHLAKYYKRKLIIKHYEKYPEELTEALFDGQFSLMFIDLNLKAGQKGTAVIEIIRKNGAYVDILLYSNNPTDLIKLTEGKNYVEGVFRYSGMKEISEKMKDVIDQVLYKEMWVEERYKTYNGLN